MTDRPRDTDLGMMTGSIKFFSKDRGFGFLIADDGRDVFFHFTGLQKDQDQNDLKPGASVTFRLWKQNGPNVKGSALKATSVSVTHLA